MRNYKPTQEQLERMQESVVRELQRENPSYAHCTITFGMLQHVANEGTGAEHYEYLKSLYELAERNLKIQQA